MSGQDLGLSLQSLLPSLLLMSSNRGGGGGQAGSDGSTQQWLHLALAMLAPLLLQLLLPRLQALLRDGIKLHRDASRSIAHTRDPGMWWCQDKDDDEALNAVVQRSILRFINSEMPDIAKGWTDSEIQVRKEEKSQAPEHLPSCADDSSSCSSGSACPSSSYSHYSCLCAPPNGVWVDLRNGIELQRTVTKNDPEGGASRGQGRQITVTFSLRSKSRRVGPQELNAFIDGCVQLYNDELRKKVDNSRYLYTPVLSAAAATDDKTRTDMLYKKYKLSDARSFASFFHPEKDQILALVDQVEAVPTLQFTNKTGKFAIPGYPLKLGFLLHGPPGTGKTSFIKTLAHYTNRHVVNIPLGKIRTNQELMNIMFDQSILLSGSEDGSAASLPHSRVIFVMEDVDAASGVVHRREPAGSKAGAAAETMALAAAMAAASSAASARASPVSAGSAGSADGSAASVSGSGSSRDEDCAGLPASDGADGGSRTMGADPAGAGAGPLTLKDFLRDDKMENDKFNLAGLLNVLDGVVDSPERIVIMTTNHPDKLDPALIRPGRVNRKIYLGYVKLKEATAMIRHYFNGGQPFPIELEVEQRLESSFVDGSLSPAQLESMCAECDTIEDMLQQLAAAQC